MASTATSRAVKALILGAALFALWLLMSGVYKPIVIALGFISCVLAVSLAARLKVLDSEGVPVTVRALSMAGYFVWLLIEVLKADWAVAKIILSPGMNLSQRILRVPANTVTDLGKVVYANSITLTPGTVTVETEGDTFVVHAVSDEAADLAALVEMNRRVCETERTPLSPEPASA